MINRMQLHVPVRLTPARDMEFAGYTASVCGHVAPAAAYLADCRPTFSASQLAASSSRATPHAGGHVAAAGHSVPMVHHQPHQAHAHPVEQESKRHLQQRNISACMKRLPTCLTVQDKASGYKNKVLGLQALDMCWPCGYMCSCTN